MTYLYWILQYAGVLASYLLVMFIWPGIVFNRFLKGRSFTESFSFCLVSSVTIVNTFVLLLGLCHVLHPVVFCIFFYGILLYVITGRIIKNKSIIETCERFFKGTVGRRSLYARAGKRLKEKRQLMSVRLKSRLRERGMEYLILLVLLVYAAIYFGYGLFDSYSYAAPDLVVHNKWIYGLTEGSIFSGGIYPEGMHCFIYAMHVVTGIDIYSSLLFVGHINSIVIILSVYILLKEIFAKRYTALIAIGMFLVFNTMTVNSVVAISRLTWTLPQEFGFPAMFLTGAFLLRFLRKGFVSGEKKRDIPGNNFDLLIFSLAIAVTITVHFYATIMAFFICIGFVPVLLPAIFKKKNFPALALGVMAACIISIVPMLLARIEGIQFQGSIGWALNVMSGDSDQDTEDDDTNNIDAESDGDSGDYTPEVNYAANVMQHDLYADTVIKGEVPLPVPKTVKRLYDESYRGFYGEKRANLMIAMTLICLAVSIILLGVNLLIRKKGEKSAGIYHYRMYIAIVLINMIFMLMYSPRVLGLPALVDSPRLCAVIRIFSCALLCIPFDIIARLLTFIIGEWIMVFIGIAGMVCACVMAFATDSYHGYLMMYMGRYNGSVMVTRSIIKQLPEFSYTIVSPVNELYDVLPYGYHEELVRFTNEVMSDDYTLPTEYVFIYIEKKPLDYCHIHFFDGPEWLAGNNYYNMCSGYASLGDNVKSRELSVDLAYDHYSPYVVDSSSYGNIDIRSIIEARGYRWCMEFEKLYPGELNTFYEDDDFVCYYFRQNQASPYQLGFGWKNESGVN